MNRAAVGVRSMGDCLGPTPVEQPGVVQVRRRQARQLRQDRLGPRA